ncbi:MAG: hypothetical protein J0M09_16925 [Xanthomonadales bacterium]|jgi:predicted Fe-Mo cluster-binding NifX family protein|nr:hypothetical protein [Xanthomonadales bacterium]
MVTIAFTTQNRRHITSHAGRCRNFMVKQVNRGTIGEWEGRSLGKDETLCARSETLPSALQDVDILITAGAGPGLQARLARFGVQVIITDVLLPDQAIAAWMADALPASQAPQRPHAPDAARGCGSHGGCDCRGDGHSH